MKNFTIISSIAAITVMLALSACGSSDHAEKKSGDVIDVAVNEVPTSTLSVLTTKPDAAIDVTAARATAAGTPVTVQGRIGGRTKPFIAGRSAFLLADLQAIKACDANPDDDCSTPWDYCCETTTKVATSTCLVQVLDANGQVPTVSLNGVGGMEPGSNVVITGTMSPQSTAESPVIIAQAVYVEQKPVKK